MNEVEKDTTNEKKDSNNLVKDSTNEELLKYGIDVTHDDADVILNQRSFDFVFINPSSCPVQHLDSVFRYTRHNGMVIVTAMDLNSLYCKSSHLADRYYNSHMMNTHYMKELAVRSLLAAVVRSAARFSKGISVMCSVAVKHGLTVCVRVYRKPALADECLKSIRKLIHCQSCQERAFYPRTNIPIENPYKLLKCNCHSSGTGKYAVELGPVWSGAIFSSQFLCDMKEAAESMKFSEDFHLLLDLLISESECSNSTKSKNNSEPPLKRVKVDDGNDRCPEFYYNLTHQKLSTLIKVQKMVDYVKDEGYRCSKTHYDSNCVRTNATCAQLVALAKKYASNSK